MFSATCYWNVSCQLKPSSIFWSRDFLPLFCGLQSDTSYSHLQIGFPKLELTVFSLLGTQLLLCTEGFCCWLFFGFFFDFSDFIMKINAVLFHEQTVLHSFMQLLKKPWSCGHQHKALMVSANYCSFVVCATVVTVVTQNLRDKGIKKYL